MTCKFKPGETYRTRDGREARVYATDGAFGNIHGAIRMPEGWVVAAWSPGGHFESPDAFEGHDLMLPKREVWIAGPCRDSRDEAEAAADCLVKDGYSRVSVLGPVEIEDPE